MKIVFVYPAYENLGIEYLSAALKTAGHQTALVYDPMLFDDTFFRIGGLAKMFSFESETVRRVVEEKPDLVAFSIVTDNVRWCFRMAGLIRSRLDVPIVAGGPHCTAVPERILESGLIDYVIVGEGDAAIVELADTLSSGRKPAVKAIRNLCYTARGRFIRNEVRPPMPDIDSLPWPDKSLYDGTPLRADTFYSTLASRGCPFRCSFCVNNLMDSLYKDKGKFHRRRSVANVIEELRLMRLKYDYGCINFLDEVFISDKKWLREFISKYKAEINLPFICCVYPSLVDEEVVRLLKEGHCVKVDMGVQSINEQLRRNVLLRHESNPDIVNAIRLFKKFDLPVYAENIVNLPGESEEDLIEMIRFYNEHRPNVIKVLWLSYFPGTHILDHAVRIGVVAESEKNLIEQGLLGHPPAHGGTFPEKGLSNLVTLFIILLSLPPKFVEILIDRRLYRYLPDLRLTQNFLVLLRAINRERDPSAEMTLVRYRKQYSHYLLAKLGLRGNPPQVTGEGR